MEKSENKTEDRLKHLCFLKAQKAVGKYSVSVEEIYLGRRQEDLGEIVREIRHVSVCVFVGECV